MRLVDGVAAEKSKDGSRSLRGSRGGGSDRWNGFVLLSVVSVVCGVVLAGEWI